MISFVIGFFFGLTISLYRNIIRKKRRSLDIEFRKKFMNYNEETGEAPYTEEEFQKFLDEEIKKLFKFNRNYE